MDSRIDGQSREKELLDALDAARDLISQGEWLMVVNALKAATGLALYLKWSNGGRSE